jgi:septum site-determining protein MinC
MSWSAACAPRRRCSRAPPWCSILATCSICPTMARWTRCSKRCAAPACCRSAWPTAPAKPRPWRAAYEPAPGAAPIAEDRAAAGRAKNREPARAEPGPAETDLREPILSAPAPGASIGAQQHLGAVRSGQQIYARDRDLIVTGAVANGAEVIADGNIHIYGGLRGRAMAGAQGDEKARIYVSDFRAELVAIAGQYRVFEQIPDDLEGQSVQCWLDGEKLLIAKL